MMRLHTAFIVAFILTGFPAFADEQPITPQSQGDVDFVSGGVDLEEYKAMQAIRGNYNLHLLFAAKGTGEYLADVKVKITNSIGETVLETISEGAYLFAKLPPGHYNLAAESGGHVINETVIVPKHRGVSVPVSFPIQKGD